MWVIDRFSVVVCTVKENECQPLGHFSRCFSLKTAFLKWIFEADPGGVQIRAASHFNGLEEIFKMR